MMNIEQMIKGFERTHCTMDLRRYADNTYMADATADKFNTYRSGWVDGQAYKAEAYEGLKKENSTLKDCLYQAQNAAIDLAKQVTHWKANHAGVVERLRIAANRPDLPSDRFPTFDNIKAENAAQASRILSLESNLSICSSAHSKLSIEIESLRQQLECTPGANHAI
jgi:chromosome condensin MukBEF ATPase and DNA-binding subunit MukB